MEGVPRVGWEAVCGAEVVWEWTNGRRLVMCRVSFGKMTEREFEIGYHQNFTLRDKPRWKQHIFRKVIQLTVHRYFPPSNSKPFFTLSAFLSPSAP